MDDWHDEAVLRGRRNAKTHMIKLRKAIVIREIMRIGLRQVLNGLDDRSTQERNESELRLIR